jgi:hypothetical protein
VSGFDKSYSAFDRFQQRHRWLGFPLAVLLKYADDQGGDLAATITYYARGVQKPGSWSESGVST